MGGHPVSSREPTLGPFLSTPVCRSRVFGRLPVSVRPESSPGPGRRSGPPQLPPERREPLSPGCPPVPGRREGKDEVRATREVPVRLPTPRLPPRPSGLLRRPTPLSEGPPRRPPPLPRSSSAPVRPGPHVPVYPRPSVHDRADISSFPLSSHHSTYRGRSSRGPDRRRLNQGKVAVLTPGLYRRRIPRPLPQVSMDTVTVSVCLRRTGPWTDSGSGPVSGSRFVNIGPCT